MNHLLALLIAAVLLGCAQPEPEPARATTYSYRCEGEPQPIVVILNGDRGHLFARQANQSIRKKAGSREFVGKDVFYRPRQSANLAAGQSADISIAARQFVDCKNDPRAALWEGAKLRGVSYRAIGNEPPWVLEIDRDKGFLLVTGYGDRKYRFPYVNAVSETGQKTTRYSSKLREDRIVITITGEACRDSMSGEAFSGRVEIDWQDRILRGCGRPLH